MYSKKESRTWDVVRDHGNDSESTWKGSRGRDAKTSAGIILCRPPDPRRGRQAYEAVLVRPRCSYAFAEFVYGHYGNLRRRLDLNLVDQYVRHMTIEERQMVARLDYQEMWRHLRGPESPADHLFLRKRALFNETWILRHGGAAQLRQILHRATGTGDIRWEFPKGRRTSPKEDFLVCALREFREETNIPLDCIQVLPKFQRRESYRHMGVTYTNIYFVAVPARDFPAPHKMMSLRNQTQLNEVADVRWKSLEDMRLVNGAVGRDLCKMARPAFNFVKNYLRGRQRAASVPPEPDEEEWTVVGRER